MVRFQRGGVNPTMDALRSPESRGRVLLMNQGGGPAISRINSVLGTTDNVVPWPGKKKGRVKRG